MIENSIAYALGKTVLNCLDHPAEDQEKSYLKGAGDSENKITVEVFGATNKQAPTVEELDAGLEKGLVLP